MVVKAYQSLYNISKWNFRLNLKLIIAHLIKVYLSEKLNQQPKKIQQVHVHVYLYQR